MGFGVKRIREARKLAQELRAAGFKRVKGSGGRSGSMYYRSHTYERSAELKGPRGGKLKGRQYIAFETRRRGKTGKTAISEGVGYGSHAYVRSGIRPNAPDSSGNAPNVRSALRKLKKSTYSGQDTSILGQHAPVFRKGWM